MATQTNRLRLDLPSGKAPRMPIPKLEGTRRQRPCRRKSISQRRGRAVSPLLTRSADIARERKKAAPGSLSELRSFGEIEPHIFSKLGDSNAMRVGQISRCTPRQQEFHDFRPLLIHCLEQRCIAMLITRFNFRTCIQQHLGHRRMAFQRCKMKRGVANIILRVGIGSPFNQLCDYWDFTQECRPKQRRVSIEVKVLDVGASVQLFDYLLKFSKLDSQKERANTQMLALLLHILSGRIGVWSRFLTP